MNPGHKCNDGFTPLISNWQDCRTAAIALGFSGDSVAFVDYVYEWGTSRPRGCFQSTGNNKFRFNRGWGGKSVGDDKILCKAGIKLDLPIFLLANTKDISFHCYKCKKISLLLRHLLR